MLGGIWMRHLDILFDRQNHKIGFTHSNCSKEYNNSQYYHVFSYSDEYDDASISWVQNSTLQVFKNNTPSKE